MTFRSELRELAFDRHGIVTLQDALSVGVPAVEVRKLASRGALTRLGQGVYRMEESPADPLAEFAAAVALVGNGAVLADDSVLAARGLAQVDLRRIRVATSSRVRKRLPPTVEVVNRTVAVGDQEALDGIPSMSMTAALMSSRGRVMYSRLVEATHQALGRGLIGRDEASAVLRELRG